MFSSKRPQNWSALMTMGMACLVVALVVPRTVHPAAGAAEDLLDGVRGLLIGLSIGLNLLAVSVRSHPRPL